METSLKKIPFFNSAFTDFDEIEEAIFMIDHHMSPYEKPTMFHVKNKNDKNLNLLIIETDKCFFVFIGRRTKKICVFSCFHNYGYAFY